MSERTESLPLSTLMESPSNPRRQFDEVYLAELAESIKHQGLLQPITVRPIQQTDLEYRYEIVFGHCRSRAARLAGLEFIPCFIRELDDEQAAEQQLHENLHRKDISAIEEADGLRALARDHRVHVNELVRRTGKSRAYIYGQIKLADSSPKLREAVQSRGLSPEVARTVARLPSYKVQDQVLARLRTGDSWATTRAAKQVVDAAVCDTTKATWNLGDTQLHGGACSQCPYLAANDPDLADLSAGACIDPDCFATKRANAAEVLIWRYREEGRPIIAGDEARDIAYHPRWLTAGHSDHIALTAPVASMLDHDTGKRVTRTLAEVREQLPRHMVDESVVRLVVIPEHEEDPQEAVPADEVADQIRYWLGMNDADDEVQLETWAERLSTPPTAARSEEEAADEVEKDPGVVAMTNPTVRREVRRRVFMAIAAAPRTTDDLRRIVDPGVRSLDDDDTILFAAALGLADELTAAARDAAQAEGAAPFDLAFWLLERTATMGGDQLAALATMLAADVYLDDPWCAAGCVAAARAYGIDPADVAANASQSVDAGSAGEEQGVDAHSAGDDQTDEAGPAGPVVRDLFVPSPT